MVMNVIAEQNVEQNHNISEGSKSVVPLSKLRGNYTNQSVFPFFKLLFYRAF
jgi:hypothetical protein